MREHFLQQIAGDVLMLASYAINGAGDVIAALQSNCGQLQSADPAFGLVVELCHLFLRQP
ncbi:hypothetical protein D3C71_2130610 [compost metagenome]